MIGRLVLSDRNIYKIKSGTKQVSARKCNVISGSNQDILIKTSKEFSPRDEYIKFDPKSNSIIDGLGQVGTDNADLDIYYHLFTNNWMSSSKYMKLWEEYIDECIEINWDLANTIQFPNLIRKTKNGLNGLNGLNGESGKSWESWESGLSGEKMVRTEYKNKVITIDPDKSIDLDDGFSFVSNEMDFQLDIHIADPVSWFNFDNPKFKQIFNEITSRLQSCYISRSNKTEQTEQAGQSNKKEQTGQSNPTHLLPANIVNLFSLLEIKSSSSIKSRRALSFCFKISKDTKQIVEFELKPTNLTNIDNYSYDAYDKFINSQFNTGSCSESGSGSGSGSNSGSGSGIKTELVELTNMLVDIIGLNRQAYPLLTCADNISHSMIEIFMILTNWWGGNYLQNILKSNPIFRVQNASDLGSDFNIGHVPEYARPFLSVSANYVRSIYKGDGEGEGEGEGDGDGKEDGKETTMETKNQYIHHSLGISNYAHLSSPMRRFIDMINHLGFYNQTLDMSFNLEQINTRIKLQKKISNAWNLLKFIKSNPKSNKFKACIFDWIKNDKSGKIMSLIVLHLQTETDKFISIVNVELPQIDKTANLFKYMELDVELYYNSNNFKSSKFPFSIKII